MRLTSRFRPKHTLAAATAGVLVLAVAAGPDATASLRADSAPRVDRTMYEISVRGAAGDGLALARRLDRLGFDLLEKRVGALVYVLGPASTAARLARLPGVTLVGRKAAAPRGPVPAAPATQDDVLPRKLKGNKYPTYYGGYRTVAGYQQFESDLEAAYPNLVNRITYGTSYTEKNLLTAVCVTVNADSGCSRNPNATNKARFLVMAQIHAREIATSEMLWRYLTRLIDEYRKDPQITALLQGSEIWVVPQHNVDGITTTQKGLTHDGTGSDSRAWQRKNLDARQAPGGKCPPPWAGSQIGVDMNRNWDSHWDTAGVSHNPCSEVYDGRRAASEPEVQSLSALFQELFKDQRAHGDNAPAPLKTTGAMVTIHSVAGLVLFPWGQNDLGPTRNDEGLRSLAFRQGYFNGYSAGQPGQVLYEVSGTTDDWTYDKLGIASLTWELDGDGGCGGTFFPAYSCMDAYESNNLPGLEYAAAAARTPYKLSLGPTILSANVNTSGADVKITATADDNAYGAGGVGRPAPQQVTAARIFTDAAPWDGGTAQAMNVKGSGTSVTATINLPRGAERALAYVQARDADGNWGPAQAVWIPAKS